MCKDGFFALFVMSFIVGILLYDFFPNTLLLAIVLFLISLLILLIYSKIKFELYLLLIVMCSLSNGYIYSHLYSEISVSKSSIVNQYLEIDGVVRRVTSSQRGGAKIELNVAKERMMLYSEFGLSGNGYEISHLMPGDRVIFSAQPKEIESFTNEFDYKSYMAAQSIFTWAYLPPDKIFVERSGRVSLPIFFLRLKRLISQHIDRLFKNRESSAIVKSILIGDRDSLDSNLKESYRVSGVYHLLALSGLHVAIIYKLILALMLFLGNSRGSKMIKSLIVILLLIFYAAIAGFSPSISRAVIMISFYEVSTYFTNRKNRVITLSFSALLILLINPHSLFDKGFQLSYLAVLSIFYIFPKLNILFTSKSRFLKRVWEIVALSISCQIATFPITYFEFGTLSPLFLVSNIVSIPFVTLLLNILPIVVIASEIIPRKEYILSLLEHLIMLLNKIIETIGGININ